MIWDGFAFEIWYNGVLKHLEAIDEEVANAYLHAFFRTRSLSGASTGCANLEQNPRKAF